jgi:hypothetical protein
MTALIANGNFFMSIEDTAKNCQFLELLLNDEVRSLSIWGLPMDFKEQMKCITNTLNSVSNQCPNLQKLVCNDDPYLGVGDELQFRDSVRMFSSALLGCRNCTLKQCCAVTLALAS